MYLCRIFFLDDRSCGLSLCSSRVLLEAKQKLAHVSVISPPRCAVTMFIPVGLSQAGGNRQTFKLLGPNCLLPQLSILPSTGIAPRFKHRLACAFHMLFGNAAATDLLKPVFSFQPVFCHRNDRKLSLDGQQITSSIVYCTKRNPRFFIIAHRRTVTRHDAPVSVANEHANPVKGTQFRTVSRG